MNIPTTACFLPTYLWLVVCMVLVNCKGGPSFKRKFKHEYNASEGSSVKLRCPVTGTNDPPHNRTLVIWLRDSVNIDNTFQPWSRFRVKAGKYLKIVNVSKKDAGVYTCKAYNEFGLIQSNITLSIRTRKNEAIKQARGEPPRFNILSKSHLTFRTGETAKLKCHSSGDPDPDVQWFKNDKPYDKNNKRAGVSASGWTLNLRYLTTHDTGQYMCRVSNKLGSITRTFVVKVKVRIPKPRIEETENTKIAVQQGKDAIIDCRAESAGKPVFTWRRWGNDFNKFNGSKNLQTSKRFGSKYVVHEIKTNEVNHDQFGTTLVITNTTKNDQGKYSCVVKNKYGSDEIAKYLLVIEKVSTALTISTTGPSSRQFQPTESRISVIHVVVIIVITTVVTIMFVIILVFCCRKQRKDLEKKYVINYKPDALLQQVHQDVTQDMQKVGCELEKNGSPGDSLLLNQSNDINVTRTLPSDPEPSEEMFTLLNEKQSPSASYCLENNCRTSNTDNLNHENSRTSSERTLSISSSREQFINQKGSSNLLADKCHPTCGTICRYKGQTNSSENSNRHLRESIV